MTASVVTNSTTVPRFVDTNVVVYAYVEDDDAKRNIARRILRGTDLVVSGQVLGEFYVAVTRASQQAPLTHDQATAVVSSLTRFAVQPVTSVLVLAALRAKERFQLSYWDAAIIEAARAAGCETVLSEDLNDGQDYDGVRVVNPFVG